MSVFFTLGYYLDDADKPAKADIIVCLGGGAKARISHAVNLYKKGYAKQNILLLTGDNRSKIRLAKKLDDSRIEYIQKNNYTDINIVHEKDLKNTKEEILFIKKYLILNNYKSAIIVSNTPHTRRIKVLLNLLKVKNTEKFTFFVLGSNEKWWHNSSYYENKQARNFAFKEFVKLSYAYVVYGFFNILGVSETLDKSIELETLKKEVNKFLITTLK